LIAKGERWFKGFDDKIIAMYARGMTVQEIQWFLLEMYSIEVSPDFINTTCPRLQGNEYNIPTANQGPQGQYDFKIRTVPCSVIGNIRPRAYAAWLPRLDIDLI
jgi:hypothetical protein